MKRCPRCDCIKDYTLFYKDKTRSDGISGYCKECTVRYQVERGRSNKLKQSAKVIRRKYYLKNRDKILQRQRDVTETWRKENPERYRELVKRGQHVRRVRLRKARAYTVLEKEWKVLYSEPCFSCGSRENQTVDHIIPIARGGKHSIGNLRTLCRPCNSSKGKLLWKEWKR